MPSLELAIPADHPAYAGHFPGRPITPGVVLLDQAQLAIETASGARLSGLAMAKFLSPAGPGMPLRLDYEFGANGVRFEIDSAGAKIASGRFNLAGPA